MCRNLIVSTLDRRNYTDIYRISNREPTGICKISTPRDNNSSDRIQHSESEQDEFQCIGLWCYGVRDVWLEVTICKQISKQADCVSHNVGYNWLRLLLPAAAASIVAADTTLRWSAADSSLLPCPVSSTWSPPLLAVGRCSNITLTLWSDAAAAAAATAAGGRWRDGDRATLNHDVKLSAADSLTTAPLRYEQHLLTRWLLYSVLCRASFRKNWTHALYNYYVCDKVRCLTCSVGWTPECLTAVCNVRYIGNWNSLSSIFEYY